VGVSFGFTLRGSLGVCGGGGGGAASQEGECVSKPVYSNFITSPSWDSFINQGSFNEGTVVKCTYLCFILSSLLDVSFL
jgi:hypothetical protein